MPTRTPAQIRATFSSEQGFVDLMYELGVGNNERDRIVADGFGSIRDLVEQYEHDIESFRSYIKNLNRTFGTSTQRNQKVYFSPPVASRMIGTLFFGIICYYSCHSIPDFGMATPELAMKWYKYYESLRQEENPETEKEIELEIPDFKGASSWREFRDMVSMRLSLIKGKKGYPIEYITDDTPREIKRANAARVFVDLLPITEDDYLKKNVVHFGTAYKDDNRRVWNVLKSLLHKAPAYNHIVGYDRLSNGRKAWETLKTFYEGEDYLQRLQDEGFAILNNTVYRGESKHYNYESYVERHVKAHKLLVDAKYGPDEDNPGMDNSTKIQYFKAGIKVEAGLEQSISSARTLGKQRGTFESYVSYIGADVDSKNDRKRELKGYKVAGVEHEAIKNKKSSNFEIVGGKRVEAKRYPRDEWLNMTRDQRRAVVRMMFKNKKKKGKNKPSAGSKKTTYDVKALQSSMQEDLVAVGDAIVAKLSASREDNNPDKDDSAEDNEKQNSSSKRVAFAGGVGTFLSKRRRSE